ncbi:MAG: PAS domain-containing sensor histidine kinase [Parvibaculum sp.]
MSIAATPHLEDLIDDPMPAWLWDVDRHKIAWGNGAAIRFWGEDGLLDLIERDFDPDDLAALHIARLAHETPEGDFIKKFEFDLAGERQLTSCRIYTLTLDDGRPGALVIVEPAESLASFTRFGEMVQEAPLPMLLFSDAGQLLHQNREAENVFGPRAREGGLLALLADTVSDPGEVHDLITQTVRAGTLSRSLTLRTRFGPRAYRVTLRRVVDPETRSHAVLFLGRDIGDRRAIEIFQSKRSGELQAMLNNVSDFQWRLDGDLRFTQLTGRFEETLGIRPEQLIGKSWGEALAQFEIEPDAALDEALTSHVPWRDHTLVWRLPIKGATRARKSLHLSMTALPLFATDGSFAGWNGLAIVKPADEGETAHPSVSADLLLDKSHEAILTLDSAGKIIRANELAVTFFGETEGRLLTSAVLPSSRPRVQNYLDSFNLPADAPYDDHFGAGIEINSNARPGKTLLLNLRPLGTGGTRAAFTAIVRDISQLKDTEAELRRALGRAKQSNDQKSEFLASIAHELRTPLNAIIGFSEIMRDEHLGAIGSEKYLTYAADIHESGKLLLSLINDLLDLSKIEAGKFEPQFEQVDVAAVIEQCVNMVKPAAADERIAVRTQIAYHTPHLVADKRSLIQILLNLLSNAVKFTSAGGQVTVSTEISPTGDLTVSVQDTGVGMSEEDLDRALVPFGQARHQARHAANPKTKGTGLGLPLSKALTAANRGSLKIETSPGNGTLVQLAFPSTQVLQD